MDIKKFFKDVTNARLLERGFNTYSLLWSLKTEYKNKLTVDELIAIIWAYSTPKEVEAGRKYTLGYFGGSGSTKIEFNERRNRLGPEKKRDKSGRWIL
jgi:hypothetical protein